ncbi:CBS domain-containing protein [Synechocystis sp. LKSZ1]|uniref:CBS domain-containing protein n=1 Tax=Synechocystis sp. LKSZ1 TaxID=3144951 RepID=UPI00336BCD67
MKVADIMTTQVVTVRGHQSVAEAVRLMKAHHIFAVIVERRHDEDAYGMITELDIISKVTAYGRDPKKLRVYEVMQKPCIVVNPDLSIEYAARLFANTGIRCAPVIREKLLGMITATDILLKGDFLESPKEQYFEQAIQKAIQEARQICAEKGHASADCRVAWDIVEELQAEAAHQRAQSLEKTALEEYVEEYPEASILINLEEWCSG